MEKRDKIRTLKISTVRCNGQLGEYRFGPNLTPLRSVAETAPISAAPAFGPSAEGGRGMGQTHLLSLRKS